MTATCTAQATQVIARSRVLIISGAAHDARNAALVALARSLLSADGIETDLLDPAMHGATDVYEKWLFADAVIFIAPAGATTIATRFRPAIDRMAQAGYPARLSERAYGVVVHGQGEQAARHALCTWLESMRMVDADSFATLDRHLGYHEPADTDDSAARDDEDYQAQVCSVARAISTAITDLREGRLSPPERRTRRA